MRKSSERLIDEESYLESQILLRVLITLVSNKVKENVTSKRLNIEINKIDPAARVEFGVTCPVLKLSANQRNRILREDLGFVIKSAGGRNRLYLDIPQLIKACEDNGVEDDCLAEWKEKLELEDNDEFSSSEKEKPIIDTDNPWETEDG